MKNEPAQTAGNRNQERWYVMKLFFVALLLLTNHAIAQNRKFPDLGGSKTESVWGPSTPKCKCIKNEYGECMYLSHRGPRYSRGSGTQNQFLPNCIEDCLPGYVDFETSSFHPRTDTFKEMDKCYVNWKRLRRANPQWNDPNWTP